MQTQQQLAATPSSDVEGLSRLTVLLGQQVISRMLLGFSKTISYWTRCYAQQ